MKRIQIWLLKRLIRLCDYALREYDDEPQHEKNWMIQQRNYFQRELDSIEDYT